ncbi:MAG TPA: LacI family DNA-binding transcriptional regulator, partial [Trueperaceae bacterium]
MQRGPRGHAKTQPRPTIEDVAQEAGVSTGTVSRVLNRRAGVRALTRQRVEAAISRLDYQPDPSARELSFRQPTRIGFNNAAPQGRLSPFYMLFLEHLLAGFQADGFRLEEIPTGPNGLPERAADGMVLLGVHDDDP